MHSRAFEKAVTRYRKRVQRRLHLQGTSTRADQSELPQANTRLEPDFPPAPILSQSTCPKLQKKSSSVHTRTQESLETLPGRVLQHAEAFRTYICLFINDGITLDTQKSVGAGAMASAGMADVGDTLRRLLDEIAMLGGIGKTTKDEILQDPDARHVGPLLLLLFFFFLTIHASTHHVLFPKTLIVLSIESTWLQPCSSQLLILDRA